MRRLLVVTAVAALGVGALAGWGAAAPSAVKARAPAEVTAPKAPPLPAEVKSRKRWVIGVKCDFPPFGYIDVRGRNAGYDVEVARYFAELAFGKVNRITPVCVTTPSRIPALQTKRVDIIVSTLTYTFARAEAIDFSIPYYGATGRLLVKNDSSIASLADLNGKTVVTTRGALYATWVRKCFGGAKLLEVDSPSSAILALKDGRADTFMFDDAFLLGVATTDLEVKLTKDKFLEVPWGIGIRKGETAMKQWVDWALRRMRAKDRFIGFLRNNAPARLLPEFVDTVPRPNRVLQYPTPATDPLNKCP
jgi:polar amino acid transport system substrate-binding protein